MSNWKLSVGELDNEQDLVKDIHQVPQMFTGIFEKLLPLHHRYKKLHFLDSKKDRLQSCILLFSLYSETDHFSAVYQEHIKLNTALLSGRCGKNMWRGISKLIIFINLHKEVTIADLSEGRKCISIQD